jgi:predicted RNase H-like nuclease (RuvC/YqgF family)
MDNEALLQVMSVVATAISSTGLAAAWFTRRTRKDREADRQARESESDKIRGEIEKMSQEAQQTILTNLRRELEAAYEDVARRRAIIEGQDRRIERQSREISRLRRQLEEMERVLKEMKIKLDEAGIPDLPEIPHLSSYTETELTEQEEIDLQDDSGEGKKTGRT